MTTSEPSEPGRTAPIELPQPAPTHPAMPAAQPAWVAEPERGMSAAPAPAFAGASAQADPVAVTTPEVTYVPLAVSVGDGFKFGCGFFLAAVVALLIGFVIFAAVFVLSTISGVSFPLGR